METEVKKLYSPTQVALGSFIGGPFIGFWFLSRNAKRLDQGNKSKSFVVLSVVVTIALLALVLVLPEKFPTGIIPLTYVFILRTIAQSIYGVTITSHLAAGGRLESWWKILGVSTLSCGLLLIILSYIASVGMHIRAFNDSTVQVNKALEECQDKLTKSWLNQGYDPSKYTVEERTVFLEAPQVRNYMVNCSKESLGLSHEPVVMPPAPASATTTPAVPVAPVSSSVPVATPVTPATTSPSPTYANPCEQKMADYAIANHADPKAYIAANQAYLQQCLAQSAATPH